MPKYNLPQSVKDAGDAALLRASRSVAIGEPLRNWLDAAYAALAQSLAENPPHKFIEDLFNLMHQMGRGLLTRSDIEGAVLRMFLVPEPKPEPAFDPAKVRVFRFGPAMEPFVEHVDFNAALAEIARLKAELEKAGEQ